MSLGNAADINFNGTQTLTINPVYGAGLHEGKISGNAFDITTPNPNNGPDNGQGAGISLQPRMAESQATGVDAWEDNKTWIYTGEVNAGPNGTLSFAENIDDNVNLKIDGVTVLNDTQWNVVTASGVLNFAPNSYHTFELRVGNGGGGAGPVAQNGFANDYGFGRSVTGATSTQGTDYQKPVDPGDGSIFRYLVAPVGLDDVHVQSSTVVTLNKVTSDSITENSIRFERPAGVSATNPTLTTLTVNGSPTVGGTLRSFSTTLANNINNSVTINGDADFAPGALTSGAASGVFLVKNGGTGTLLLDNPTNSLGGATLRVTDGLVSVVGRGGTANPLSTLTNQIAINGATGRLRLGSGPGQSTTFNNSINASQSGTLEHVSATNDILSGNLVIASGKTLTANISAGQLQLVGPGSLSAATGALIKTGAGTFRSDSGATLSSVLVTQGRAEFRGLLTLQNSPTISAGATLVLRDSSGSNSLPGTISIPSGTLDVVPGALGDTGNVVQLNGGALTLSGVQGLVGQFFSGDDVGAHANFNAFDTYNTYLNGRTPTVTQLTSFGGVDLLSFNPDGSDAAMFLVYGFTPTNNIVSRMKGKILIAQAGNYTFNTRSDDGSVLFIDNNFVVNNNFDQGMTTRSGSIALSAGIHDIDIGYYEGGGGNGLVVSYSGPGITGISGPNIPGSLLPNAVLFPNLDASVFENAINVTANSTINAAALKTVADSVTVNGGNTLTLNGNALTINALTLAGSGAATFNVANETTVLAAIDGGAARSLVKTGLGTLIFDDPATPQFQTAGSTITINQGAIGVVLGGTNQPLGNAGLVFNGGGVVLSSKTNAPGTTADQTFVAPSFLNGGVLSARKLGSGVAGTAADPVVVNVSGNLNVGAGNTLKLSTADFYQINVGGTATGGGIVAIDSGVINATTATALQGFNVSMNPVILSTATLNLKGASNSLASLSGGSAGGTANVVVGSGSGPGSLIFTGSGSARYGGTISDAPGGGATTVTMSGTGTQGLASGGNFTGGIVVTNGVLELGSGNIALGQNSAAGTGAITLAGGTLQFSNPGLLLKIYDHDPNEAGVNNAYNGSLNTLSGVLTHFASIGAPAVTTLTSANGNTTISYNPDGDADAPFAIHGSTALDNIEAIFTGKFNAPAAGVYNFDPRSDDGTNVFIDGNLIVNNNFPQGIGHASRAADVTLTAGLHDIVITFNEGTGGAGMFVNYTTPGGTAQALPNGSGSNPVLLTTDFSSNNPLFINANSALDLRGGNVSLGSVTQNAGTTLNTTAGTVTFSDVNLLAGTYNYAGAGNIVITQVNAFGNPVTINRSGGGTLVLGTPVSPQFQNPSSVLNANNGSTIVAIASDSSANNPLGLAPVNLNGGGLALSSSSGDVSFSNAVNLVGNGTISAGNFGGGAINTVQAILNSGVTVGAGKTLTVNANSGYTLVLAGGVSGAGNVISSGGDVVSPNTLDVATGTISVTGGTLTALGSGPSALHASSISVTGGTLRSQFAPINATSGTTVGVGGIVELNGTNNIGGAISLQGGTLRAASSVNDLLGGTIAVAPVAANTQAGKLRAGLLPNRVGDGILTDTGISTLLTRTPQFATDLTGNLDFGPTSAGDAAIATFFGAPVTATDIFTATFTGKFTAAQTGAYTLNGFENDDNLAFWVDLNQNGIFETAGSAGNELAVQAGCCGGDVSATANLKAGQSYRVAFVIEDTGGGGSIGARFSTPTIPLTLVNPGANPGLFSYDAPTGGGLIRVDSTAELKAGAITNGQGIILDASGTGAKLSLADGSVSASTANTLTTTGTGFATVDLAASKTLTLNRANVSTGTTFVKSGAGSLVVGLANLGNNGTFNTEGGTTTFSDVLTVGPSTINNDIGVLNVNGNANGSTVNVSATTRFGATQTLEALNINNGGTVTLSSVPVGPGIAELTVPAQAVPEPGTIGLLATGLLGLFGRRRKTSGK